MSISGCAPHVKEPESATQERARSYLAEDLANLMDSNGLVINPGDGSPRPIDTYSSAWLLTMMDDLGEKPALSAASLSEDEAARMRSLAAELPPTWRAWSWLVMANHGFPTSTDASNALTGEAWEKIVDEDDRALRLWVEDLASQQGVATMDAHEIDAAVPDASANSELGAPAAWRLHRVCDHRNLKCKAPALPSAPSKIPDIASVLELSASAELVHSGVEVNGYDGPTAVELAVASLKMLPDGNDIAAARLTRILVLENADTSTAKSYLARASDRRDPVTGLYRQHVDYQGTVAATYAARTALGPRFDDLVSTSTRDTVADLLAATDVAPSTRLQAIAVITPFGESSNPAHRAEIRDVARSLTGLDVPPDRASSVTELLLLLQDLGEQPTGVHFLPIPVTDETEETVARILLCALSGLIDNAEEILEYYADYLHELPERLDSNEPSSSTFIAELTLLDFLEIGDNPDLHSRLLNRVESRIGCPETPHLASRGISGAQGYDVLLTAQLVNTQIGMEAIGDHTD
ncbi:hypothetical protein [Demequina oxidasica]|uniref:hypothetical protein n=1 Tax=Demequina oxidasica TaxID=676199 RepID=UPI00128C671C|nr:hypothetical protein [Demequina oxidasica]